MSKPTSIRAVIALAAGVLSISWSAIFVRWSGMPGVASAFYRVLIASVALWLTVFIQRIPLRPATTTRGVLLTACAGIFFAGDIGCYNVAVLHTSAGAATFLGNNAPLAVGLITWALTGKLPPARFWWALLTATCGACLILSTNWNSLGSATSADLLAVVASVFFALYLVTTQQLRVASSTVIIALLSTSASAISLLLVAVLTGVSLHIPSTQSFLALIGLGVLCQLGGYVSLTYALGHLPATVSAIVMLAVAPLTALLAFFLFGEAMSSHQAIGGGLILVAVWIVTRSSHATSQTFAPARPADIA